MKKTMIDIHCHIIFGVDDGPSTIDDSTRMIIEAEKLGIKKIIATPHFNKQFSCYSNVFENFYKVKSRAENSGVELFLGYEVFLCTSLSEIISDKKRYTLNNSEYLLFELPFNIIPVDTKAIINKLYLEGLIPIIAHPERNSLLMRNTNKFDELIESGCLIQVDAASIIGAYGSDIEHFAKKLINSNLVSFVASDAHKPSDYTSWYLKSFEKVRNWAGKEFAERLYNDNQNIILY